MKFLTFFGFFLFPMIAFLASITQADAIAWAGVIATILSILVMGSLPLYAKVRETLLKAEVASREARKEDCQEALQRQKDVTNDLSRRIVTLERECQEWQRLYDAGSRDYPKLEGNRE